MESFDMIHPHSGERPMLIALSVRPFETHSCSLYNQSFLYSIVDGWNFA